MRTRTGFAIAAALVWLAAAGSGQRYGGPGHTWWSSGQGGFLGWDETFDNPDGQAGIVNKKGAVRTDGHPFFDALGANGRACVTCHQPANAMSVSAASLRERWTQTGGRDPVFAAIDGSNCPGLPQADERSHSLLLERGLFRIELPWPPAGVAPDFRVEVVRDPTGCNQASGVISVYRRPRMAANLEYVVPGPERIHLMADGREPTLQSQAASAIRIHEQAAAPPSPDQLALIVAFESQIYAAQFADIRAGLLGDKGGPALLGPDNLASGKAGALASASPFEIWRHPEFTGIQGEFRASAARGSDLFFRRKLNQNYTCAGCHAPGTARWMDVGTANTTPAGALPDLPLFRIVCDTGSVVYTQDPGRALISGKCADVGAIVLQQLRGLAARAPYFSNGRAGTLREVVDFYDRGFRIGYTEQEKRDLVNFLRVL